MLNMSASINRRGNAFAPSHLRAEVLLSMLSGIAIVWLLGARLGGEAGVTLALTIFCSAAGLAAFGVHRTYGHAEFGMGNLITMSRLALTASLAALVFAPAPPEAGVMWLAFGIAALALSLDGVDGWAARRAGLVSRFGAQFDMEVDSLFALILAIVLFQTGQAGPWILILGLPRYLFLLASLVWPQLTRDLPDTLSRKAVCVLQIGTLVGFLVPIIPPAVMTAAALIAALALTWSFLSDIRMLLSADQ